MSHNILLLTWDNSSKAYEAYSQVKNQITDNVYQLAVIERQTDGQLKVNDGYSYTAGNNTIGGGLVGTLIGILGGPLGMLLGFSTGALIGSLVDIDDAGTDEAVLTEISKLLPLGSTGLLIDLEEQDENVTDSILRGSGGAIYRWDYDVVEAEVEASIEAWEQANKEANKILKEQRKEENKQKRQQKWSEFKAKFKK
ncbi:DUF1269 domain-containing protein [Acinetobacter guerrae]|uniref:DUF1269 domain-containing protein n=1 Tax=Acinetobacter guerrae TaxID=1843371 RepID=A0A3A8EA65_9GAMM|nr:DUF1269 domain-containing protein [Acinetobacter guerrae]MPW45833.1 hypothetical protein [Acinetobacter guerrae]RKG31565.1 DUF1269 domain-containing protein [Acinetobacter guerrae]